MINWFDLLSILIIASTLLASSFLFFLPLVLLLGNKKTALEITIPVSISIQIIFAYIFYSLDWISQYPPIYFILGAVINILSIFWLAKLGKLKNVLGKSPGKTACIFSIILFLIIIISRFYDSFRSIAPGEIDTYNHTRFLLDLTKQGFLSFPQYAPGFHLFVYPLTFVSKLSEIYRFAGPAIGVISSLSLYLILRNSFKRQSSQIVLLALLCFPIFDQLFLQQIGFFSTSLSFIFFPVFLYALMVEKEKISQYKLLLFYSLTIVALSLTVPYLYVQYLPALALYVLAVFLMRRRWDKLYIKRIIIILAISIIGFFVAFGHVYLQTKILKRSTSFPPMQLTHFEDGNLVSLNNYSSSNTPAEVNGKETLLDSLEKKEIFVNYITPMYNIATNVFSIKNIRPLDSILSIGAYLWILVSMILFFFSYKLKDKILLVISSFTIIFGLATQLGILEISTYRGRSGWYLMLLLLAGLVFVYDRFIWKYFEKKWFLIPALLIVGLTVFLKPPVYYRAYYTDAYEVLKKAASLSGNSSILILAKDRQLSLLSDKIIVDPLSVESVEIPCNSDKCFIVLEKNFLTIDPVLSQQAIAGDDGFSNFIKTQNELKLEQTKLLADVKAAKEFSKYKLYWENNNISIYEYANQ